MLDSAQGGSLLPVNLFAPQTIAAAGTNSSPSGAWVDMTQFSGYVAFLVNLGTMTETSVSVQLASSASATGSAPLTGGAGALFPTVLAAGTPTQQILVLPSTFFANRFVGAQVTTVGAGATPISITAVGGLRTP